MRTGQAVLARDEILAAIKDTAERGGLGSLSKKAFTAATGITEYEWTKHWSRWSDAVADAGLRANQMQSRHDSLAVLRPVALLAAKLGRMPTIADLRVARHADGTFPSKNTVANHYGSQAGLVKALRSFCTDEDDFRHVFALLPQSVPEVHAPDNTGARADGWVYLLKSGAHYKIGRSDEVERRVKEISVALPEVVTMVHAIRTDDPAGIEAYWHRRFASKRANGEWFRLERVDISAFTRRKYQ